MTSRYATVLATTLLALAACGSRHDDHAAERATPAPAGPMDQRAFASLRAQMSDLEDTARRYGSTREMRVECVSVIAAALGRHGEPIGVTIGSPDTTLDLIASGCSAEGLRDFTQPFAEHLRVFGFTHACCAGGTAEIDL